MPPGAEEYANSPFNFGNQNSNPNTYDYGPASNTPGVPQGEAMRPPGFEKFSDEDMKNFADQLATG